MKRSHCRLNIPGSKRLASITILSQFKCPLRAPLIFLFPTTGSKQSATEHYIYITNTIPYRKTRGATEVLCQDVTTVRTVRKVNENSLLCWGSRIYNRLPGRKFVRKQRHLRRSSGRTSTFAWRAHCTTPGKPFSLRSVTYPEDDTASPEVNSPNYAK